MAFWNRKKLIEYDPRTLDLEKLSLLEKSLMAKLLLVNNELITRYTRLMEASMGLPGMDDGRKVFADGVARCIKLNIILEDELARVLAAQTSDGAPAGDR